MNALKFKQIIYLISVTVVVTVAAQVYTNVQNYSVNKQRFERDVQQALDLAVEAYYADRARNEVVIFAEATSFSDSLINKSGLTIERKFSVDSSIHLSSSSENGLGWNTFVLKDDSLRSSFTTKMQQDSGMILRLQPDSLTQIEVRNKFRPLGDSIELQFMAKKILASLRNEGLDFERLNGYLNQELERKKITIAYQLVHKTMTKEYRSTDDDPKFELVSSSKSTYLPRNQSLEIHYENASLAILKKGAIDLLISLLIIGSVVGSLLYLYRVINEQKQLAEIKNDLISNITHEFKTPIATISTAIEGIALFNQNNDLEKTKKYLGISSDQLKKLNTMVEKLLETATIDSDEIELTKESTEVVELTKKLLEKFELVKGEKDLMFSCVLSEKWVELDLFHMENAISNLIDNALKYGGNKVEVRLSEQGEKTAWQVIDDGGKLDKQQQERLFEKFYRVPTGNVHNVKGFGIGLYYSKAMVEKHQGTIDLKVRERETKFTITI